MIVYNNTDWLALNEYQFKNKFMHSWAWNIFPTYTILLFLLTLIPTILVLRRLFSKGTSWQLKKLIFWRTMIYLIFYMMFVLEVLHDQLAFDKKIGRSASTPINWLFKIGGLPLALTRILEPYVL